MTVGHGCDLKMTPVSKSSFKSFVLHVANSYRSSEVRLYSSIENHLCVLIYFNISTCAARPPETFVTLAVLSSFVALVWMRNWDFFCRPLTKALLYNNTCFLWTKISQDSVVFHQLKRLLSSCCRETDNGHRAKRTPGHCFLWSRYQLVKRLLAIKITISSSSPLCTRTLFFFFFF